jgi:hypothetical protein
MTYRAVLVALWCVVAVPGRLDAYIGPGAGITVIGTAVAFVGAVVFALVGFVWYPLKRLRNALRSSRGIEDADPKAPLS